MMMIDDINADDDDECQGILQRIWKGVICIVYPKIRNIVSERYYCICIALHFIAHCVTAHCFTAIAVAWRRLQCS